MPVQKRAIVGKMDLQSSKFLVKRGDYTYAENIMVTDSNGVVRGVKGNRAAINYTLPAGTNRCIGYKDDTLRNRVIFFVYNSNNFHSILLFRNDTRQVLKVIESRTDSADIDILGFSLSKFISSVEIIHSDEDGDLLLWTDGYQAPKKFNLTRMLAGGYGVLDADFITAQKRPPATPIAAAYGDDSDRIVTTFRRKLFQFTYRFVYDDFEKSTWATYSKVPLPANVIGTDVDLDGSKNNYITLSMQTGKRNVTSIEVAARESQGGTWSDLFLIASLKKNDLAIADEVTYTHRFYNDGLYAALDPAESILNQDWFPRAADAMCLANGNTAVYAGIREGYDKLSRAELSVHMSVDLIKNSGTGTSETPLLLPLNFFGDTTWNVWVIGSVPEGTRYTIYGVTSGNPVTLADYTSIAGDDRSDVALGLKNSANPAWASIPFGDPNQVMFVLPVGDYISSAPTVPGSSSGTTTLNSATSWSWYDRRKFGICYFDRNGFTPGVETYENPTVDGNDFVVETPAFASDTGVPKTPVISLTINHYPPTWAESFCIVRTRSLAMSRYLYYGTHDFQTGTGTDTGYYFIGLGNIAHHKEKNDKFIYSSIADVVAAGDRIRVIDSYAATTGLYTGTPWNHDYEILGIVERQMTGGTSTDLAKYVKVKAPLSAPSPAYGARMLVMVYTPATNAAEESQVYYEFGETYEIYNSNGFKLHRGGISDQTIGTSATFEFIEGDAYFKSRFTYDGLIAASPSKVDLLLMDSNYSDFFASSVNSNGRPQVNDVNMKEQYNPVLVRFSQSYISGTNINGLNRFYYDNFDEYDRRYGAIRRLKMRERQMRVFQQFKCGLVPVLESIQKFADGQDSLVLSDRLLNPIHYYAGDHGIGDLSESLASAGFVDYFCDNNSGTICRLSNDGITPISITENANQFAVENLTLRSVSSKVFGAYDSSQNRYVIAMQATGSSPAKTIVFNETRNGFETFLTFEPEMIGHIGTMLIAFKNGAIWTHDSSTYCRFFGVQYKPKIRVPFNDVADMKKSFKAVSVLASQAWVCPQITTSIGQASSLITGDFKKREGVYHASLLRDINSPKGIAGGDTLKGEYIELDFSPVDGSVATEFVAAEISFSTSNLNNR